MIVAATYFLLLDIFSFRGDLAILSIFFFAVLGFCQIYELCILHPDICNLLETAFILVPFTLLTFPALYRHE